MTRSRPAAAALLALATLGTTLLGAGTAQAAQQGDTPPVNAIERAAMLTRPAVVRLDMHASGVVEDPTGTLLREPVERERDSKCTGFGINPDGYVATAGHCVDITTLRGAPGKLINDLVQEIVAADPTKDPAVVLEFAEKHLKVRGATPGSPIDLQVVVGIGSMEAGDRHPADVIGYRGLDDGDVALLKIDVKDLPTVPLATDADVRIGTDILTIGFPGSADRSTDMTFEPSNKDGRISSKRTSSGVPIYETSAAMSSGMSGGPAVDMQGRLVGSISWRPPGEPSEINFLAASDTLSAFMASKGVQPQTGRLDTMFRTALDAYYTGHYADAIAGFDALLVAAPGHPQARQMRVAAIGAREKYGDAWPPFGPTSLLFWSIVGGAGALLLRAVVRLVDRARRGRAAAAVASQPVVQPFGPRSVGSQAVDPPLVPVPTPQPMHGTGV